MKKTRKRGIWLYRMTAMLFILVMSLLMNNDCLVKAETKNIMDNYVLSTIYEKIQVPRSENADGTITYQTYIRNLNIDVSNVDEKNLALSMKVFVKQVEGERNPLEIFTYKNLASFLEIADAQLDLDSYVNLPVKNLKRADGSDLVAGEWNDVLIPFSVGTKKSNFDPSKITWFRLCLTRLPKDIGYQSLRLKDVCIVDTSRKAEKATEPEVKKWDTTYNVGSVPLTMDKTIESAAYVGDEYKMTTPIDISKHNPEKMQLQMDIEVENLTNPGDVSPLLYNNGKQFIELSSAGSATDQMVQFNMKNLPWKNGKNTYTLNISNAEAGAGEIDYSKINYMRIYFVHTTFTDKIKIKINNIKLIDNTNQCTVPTIFSDRMMFQQNKPITVWGTGKAGNNINVKLINKQGQTVTESTVAVGTDGNWKANLQQQKGSYDTYSLQVYDNGTLIKTVKDILIGELWLACGQSNMALTVYMDMDRENILANANNSNLRFFLEPTYPAGQTGAQPLNPNYDVEGAYWGKGNDVNAVNKMSAVAYSFAKNLQAKLNVPVGVLNTPIGGTVIEGWIPRDGIEGDASLIKELEKRGLYYDEEFWSDTAGTMSTLYNQKVGPLTNFKIAGAIWYQGESNSGRSEIYDKELTLLKKTWSEKFGFENNSMPFIFTQVAPGQYDQGNKNMEHLGYLATAMSRSFVENKNNNMSMITIYDLPLVHVKDGVSSAAIHPRTKQPVGERFCTAAMNMVYGGGDVYTAPIYKSMQIKGNAIYLTFDYVGKGLSIINGRGNTVHGFSIAGSDGIYVNAKAEIVGNNVIKVYNERVENPKNVNYGFNNFNYGCNVKNSAGIPIAPFRTQTVTGTDTTYNPTKDITYFTSIDWIYGDEDVWIYDKDNPDAANQSLGIRPAWKAENGTYSYDANVKSEGKASVKLTWNGAGTSSVGPIVTYGSQIIDYGNFKNVSFKINNKDEAAKNVALKITSGDKTYTVIPESGQNVNNDTVTLSSDNKFSTVTFDMTSLKNGNTTESNPADIWNNITDMKLVFNTSKGGSVYVDDVSFGMTKKVAVDVKESNEVVAWYDFNSDSPSGKDLSVDLSINNANQKKFFVEYNGNKCIKLGQYEYAHFAVENNVVTKDDNNLMIRITYFDNTNAYYGVQYNTITDLDADKETSATKFKTASVLRGGTNKWTSTSVCISDASFRHGQFGKYDFRLYGNGNAGTYISKIEIIKKSVNPDIEPVTNRRGKTEHAEFTGKSFAGYQAWFGTGTQYTGWGHYDYGSADSDGTSWPRKNHISIDYFPYVKEYDESALAQTGFANLGSGEPTKLYDSTNENVINTHFKWMSQYGIDGAAIQRFAGTIKGRTLYDEPQNTLLYKMQKAAENNNSLFYIMYDISGGDQIKDANDTTSISSWVNDIKFDWVYNIEKQLQMTNSDAYATVDGKPVVCLWGTTVSGRPDRVEDYQEMINFFHNRGCYVIFGTGRDWSTNTATMSKYEGIFKQVDMISPWMVGSNISSESAIDGLFKTFIEKHWQWCRENNVDYYPVLFSGFSWALWHGGDTDVPNAMPRNAGKNFWYQAYKLKQLGIKSFYIAMFDEYDEGTAIAKNASDYFDIPQDQWFVTASCDGYWCSQDFQLRVVGEANKMVKGLREAVKENPVPQSEGPIYYRNSFESKYVECPSEKNPNSGYYPVDPCFKNDKQVNNDGVNATVKIERNEIAKTGDYMTTIDGITSKNNASYLYQISETKINMNKGLKLSYSIYAQNKGGANTNIVLILSDGSKITAKAKQTVTVGKWTDCSYEMPKESLAGKTIVGIGISYNGSDSNFKAYYDDIILEDNETYAVDKTELKSVQNKVAALNKNEYTADSWNKVETALNKANSLSNTSTQEEMDSAVKVVNDAINGLVKKPVETTIQMPTTVAPTTQAPTTAKPTTQVPTEGTTTNTFNQEQESTENVSAADESTTPHIDLKNKKIKMGKKEKLRLRVKSIGLSNKLKFKSSNKKVVSVTRKGKLKAKKKGKAIITIYGEKGITAVCKVTVKKAPKSIVFKKKPSVMKVGDTFKLKTKLSNKSAGSVKFISKNKKVIKVSKDGMVKALRKGKAEIIARTYNRKEARIIITVK